MSTNKRLRSKDKHRTSHVKESIASFQAHPHHYHHHHTCTHTHTPIIVISKGGEGISLTNIGGVTFGLPTKFHSVEVTLSPWIH